MTWSFTPALQHFESVRADWDALNRVSGNHILLDSAFVAPLLRHFGSDQVLLATSKNSSRPAMALLTPTRRGFWETFQPSQAPLGLLLLGPRETHAERLLELTRALPGYALQCAALHQDPDISFSASDSQQPHLEFLDYILTGSLELKGTFEEYWQSRSDDIKRNNARRHRRIAEQGLQLDFTMHSDPVAVASAIREYGRLESAGWKGQEGTAVTADDVQGRFYREVMEFFCARGEGVIFELSLDHKTIASELWIGRNGMLVNLKTAYDESLKQFSPGFLMKEALLRKAFAHKEWRVLEFYGRVMDWHRKWIDRTRTLYHVNCYRYTWVRRARDTAKRFLKSPAPVEVPHE